MTEVLPRTMQELRAAAMDSSTAFWNRWALEHLVRNAGGLTEQATDSRLMLVGRQQYDLLARTKRWPRDPVIAPLRIPTPWLLPDGRPPGVNRSTPLAKNYIWAEPWHFRFDPWPWYIEPAAIQANAPKERRHGQDH